MTRNSWIDIIRAFAAFTVLLTHISYVNNENMIGSTLFNLIKDIHDNFVWTNQGLHSGVIIFIVLSGFCIHMSAIDIKKNDFIKIYSIRRFFRIFPLFVFSLLFGCLAFGLTNDFNILIIKNFFFNIFMLHAIIPSAGPLGNEILGTVIVECILYAVYPFIILKLKDRWLLLFGSLLLLHIASFSLVLIGIDPVWVQRNVFTVLIYWWIGAFIAELYFNKTNYFYFKKFRNISLSKKIFFGFIFYFFYLLICFSLEFKGSHIIKSLVLVLLIAYLLTWILDLKSSKTKFITFFENLGLISYSVYVLQLPILILIQFYIGLNSLYIIYSFSFTILLSIICFNMIEKPSHNYGKKISRKYF